jgi:hypothetical protein
MSQMEGVLAMAVRGVYVVLSNCADPERVDEFRTWYSATHIPDLLATPGFVRARLFESREVTDDPQFVAVYDLESDDLDQTVAAWRARIPQLIAQGRMSELLDRKFGRHFELITDQSA